MGHHWWPTSFTCTQMCSRSHRVEPDETRLVSATSCEQSGHGPWHLDNVQWILSFCSNKLWTTMKINGGQIFKVFLNWNKFKFWISNNSLNKFNWEIPMFKKNSNSQAAHLISLFIRIFNSICKDLLATVSLNDTHIGELFVSFLVWPVFRCKVYIVNPVQFNIKVAVRKSRFLQFCKNISCMPQIICRRFVEWIGHFVLKTRFVSPF